MTESSAKGYRFLFLSMLVVIVGLGVLTYGGIAIKLKDKDAKADDENCIKDPHIYIKSKGELKDVKADDGEVQMVMKLSNELYQILTIDNCKGKVVGDTKIIISPEDPKAKENAAEKPKQ